MRHVNYTLTPKAISAAKPKESAYSLTDGGGLHIEVLPSGSKVWRFKYHMGDKREKVTIGSWPAISLKDARDEHERMRAMVARGRSPAKEKKAEAERKQVEEAQAVTFEQYARGWVKQTLAHVSPRYRTQLIDWLESWVFPAIGSERLADVKPRQVLALIQARADTPTTADEIRAMIQRIYNHAIRNLVVEHNPAAAFKGVIERPPKQHHKHLTEPELKVWWRALDGGGAHATTILASKLLLLTMVRKSELRLARWSEFDLDRALWDIPAQRMKMRRQHRVYLSRQAVSLLRQLHALTGHTGPDGWILPSIHHIRRRGPMADVTLNHFFERLAVVKGFSPHGTRGTAATLLLEHKVRKEVVDLLLAHKVGDGTDAAYMHHELPDERREALQFLADYIDQLTER